MRKALLFVTYVLIVAAATLWLLAAIGWVIEEPGYEPLVTLLAGLISALAALASYAKAKKNGEAMASEQAPRREPSPSQREAILSRIERDRVNDDLAGALGWGQYISIPIRDRSDLVDHATDTLMPGRNQIADRGSEVIDAFEESSRQLLVVGNPGSGKSVKLLEITGELIREAKLDPSKPIPAYASLSSWLPKTQPLEEWLVGQLMELYQIPEAISWYLLDNYEWLPVLDGLDEMEVAQREACISSINEFVGKFGLPGTVVGCELSVCEGLGTRLKLRKAILLLPLARDQIGEHLKNAGIVFERWNAGADLEGGLLRVLESPLGLAISVRSLQSMSREMFLERAWPMDQVWHVYVHEMLSERRPRGRVRFASTEVLSGLQWLATYLSENGPYEFYLEKLQPSTLVRPVERWLYLIGTRTLEGMLIGLVFTPRGSLVQGPLIGFFAGIIAGVAEGVRWRRADAADGIDQHDSPRLRSQAYVISLALATGILIAAICGLAYGLTAGPTIGIIAAAIYGIGYGLVFGLSFGLRSLKRSWRSDIRPVEKLTLSWAEARNGASSGLKLGLAVGLGVGISFTAAYLLTPGLIEERFGVEPIRLILVSPLILLLSGMVGALLFAVIGAVWGAIQPGIVAEKQFPNQGIKLALRNALLAGIILFVVGLVTIGITGDITFALSLGLLALLFRGGFEVLRHYSLRLILSRAGYISWSFVAFLEHGVERLLLRKVGGGYKFIHGTLRDYFAGAGIR